MQCKVLADSHSLESACNKKNCKNLESAQGSMKNFGKSSGFNPAVDFDSSGIINLYDVMVVVRNWGRSG